MTLDDKKTHTFSLPLHICWPMTCSFAMHCWACEPPLPHGAASRSCIGSNTCATMDTESGCDCQTSLGPWKARNWGNLPTLLHLATVLDLLGWTLNRSGLQLCHSLGGIGKYVPTHKLVHQPSWEALYQTLNSCMYQTYPNSPTEWWSLSLSLSVFFAIWYTNRLLLKCNLALKWVCLKWKARSSLKKKTSASAVYLIIGLDIWQSWRIQFLGPTVARRESCCLISQGWSLNGGPTKLIVSFPKWSLPRFKGCACGQPGKAYSYNATISYNRFGSNWTHE